VSLHEVLQAIEILHKGSDPIKRLKNTGLKTHSFFTGRLRVLVLQTGCKLILGGTIHVVLDHLKVYDQVKYCPQLSENLLQK